MEYQTQFCLDIPLCSIRTPHQDQTLGTAKKVTLESFF